ncbi:DsbA family protein [Rugamonas sp.]|uniref:DsbA family protein n=1 Tax=Rugamonas sp. TaxID=1926287 RepID=UPI0025D88E6E|nr:DsbA family protein [Rugamonas sp.]
MKVAHLPLPTVTYVMDAYCGWCWGYAERLAEFAAANGHRVHFTAISGGLFTGARAAPISAFPHIPEANARIGRLTGATFGPAYQQLLAQGSMVMDSTHAAAGYAALRALAPERALYWAHRLQDAFYQRGRSLSEAGTIAEIATAAGYDAGTALGHLADGSALAWAQADFALARRLGVDSYPTLLWTSADGAAVHALGAAGSALHELNARLDALLHDHA